MRETLLNLMEDMPIPGNLVRIAVTTLPTIVIEEDGRKKVLLGYNPGWKEFDPIGGGYMIQKHDLEKIACEFPSVSLEMHISRAMKAPLNAITAKKGTAVWMPVKYAAQFFEQLYEPADICGNSLRVADSRMLVDINEKDKLFQPFLRREYGISPELSELQELCEELSFDEPQGYDIAPKEVIQRNSHVSYGTAVVRDSFNKRRNMHSFYLDYRVNVTFDECLKAMIVEHCHKSRLMENPGKRLILATAEEIKQGNVTGKDLRWCIPTNGAIDLSKLE